MFNRHKIIQEIWNLGEKVQLSYLPKFLDEKLIYFLFIYSHKNVELKKVNDLLSEIISVSLLRGNH